MTTTLRPSTSLLLLNFKSYFVLFCSAQAAFSMDFPIIRKARVTGDHSAFVNGMMNGSGFESRRRHTQEKDLPSGPNWVVQKFGGTSVGKFGAKIAEDIVIPGLKDQRLAIVCSARSTSSKSEGTTTRLLRAARNVEEEDGGRYAEIVEAIRSDHIHAGEEAFVKDEHSQVLQKYVDDVMAECDNLLKILQSAHHLGGFAPRTKDMILSTGEKLACHYMAALLSARGIKAVYVDISEVITFSFAKGLGDDFYSGLAKVLGERVSRGFSEIWPGVMLLQPASRLRIA